MSEVPVYEQVSAVSVDPGTGVARAETSIGPARYGDIWKVVLITTQSTSTTDVELRLYRNVESPGSMIDSTYSGRSATSPCEVRSEEHKSELQSLMRNSYAVLC